MKDSKGGNYRVAMYSPGMVGLGHIRRNASIAQELRRCALQPVILMIAETRQAGALPMPEGVGVDCVTLPALRKEADGCCKPRYLDVSNEELIALRSKVISRAIKAFEPDMLIVDDLPLGAGGELARTLERSRRHGTRCVLGVRDVLQDPESVRNSWSEQTVRALHDYYDAIWNYGDLAMVDMSSFLGFKREPEAPRRLAEYIHAAAERAVTAAPPMPKSVRLPADNPPTQRTDLARSAPNATLPGPVTAQASPARGGASELRVQSLGAAAPAVAPAPVRQVRAKSVAFRRPHAGDENRFLLEERTTEFDDGTSSKDYIWVRGQYVLVVPVWGRRVVFIRQYKKAAEQNLLVLPWGEIERDETPLAAGRRELEEETGYSFDTAEVYGPFYDLPDKSTGGHWVVVARNTYRKAAPAPDEGERISGTEPIPVRELWQHHIPVLMHVGALRLAGF
jgi:8-oxo-dGTP pyrophosphatase MutT (NUDIX family)